MFYNTKKQNQRGAMFGVDARIAIATFSTIAIITGYMGISKIDSAGKAALVKEILAYEDAIEQIQTDVGVFYQFAIDTSDGIKDFNAIEIGDGNVLAQYLNKWNGPYIEGIRQSHPIYGDFTLTYAQDDFVTACNINNDCFVWIVLTNIPSDRWDFFNAYIDEDGGTTPEADPTNEGRVRADGVTANRTLRYRTETLRTAG